MTTINNIYRIFVREWHRIAARPLYWMALLVFPVLSMLFFTSLMNDGVPMKLPVAVVDLDHSPVSRKFIRAIDATPATHVSMQLASEREAMSELRKGAVYGYLVLPRNLQAGLIAGKQPQLRFYYQNSLLIAGGLIQNDFTLISHMLSAGAAFQKRETMGQNEQAIKAAIQPIRVDNHLLFNASASYPVYVTTILLPIMLQLFILMISVYSIGIEIKEKTSREWLKLADNSMVVALTGKLLPYTIVFMVLVLMQNVLLYRLLMVPLHTSTVCLIAASALYVIAYQAIAVFFAGLLPMLRHAINLAAFYGILALTLCGFSFPTESMYPVFRIWGEGFPVRHFMHIFQGQMLAGFGFGNVALSYLYLMLFTLLPFTVWHRLKAAMLLQHSIERTVHVTHTSHLTDSEVI